MPGIEVKHPVTGKTHQVRWDEGHAPPTPEQINSLFESQPTDVSVAPPDPVPTKSSGPRLGTDYTATLAPQPNPDRQAYDAVSPVRKIVNTLASGPANVLPAISRGVSRIKKGVGQLAGPMLSPTALSELTSDPAAAAREVGMPTGPLGIGFAGQSREYNDIPQAPGGVTRGALNVGAGAGEGLIGLLMGTTPVGAGFAASQNALSQIPKATGAVAGPADVANLLSAPASATKLAQHLGVTDPDIASSLNMLGDVTTQAGALHTIKGGSLSNLAERVGPIPAPEGGSILGQIMPNGEKIAQAAIKVSGKIFVGKTHAEAVDQAARAGIDVYDPNTTKHDLGYEEGFSGDKGTYYTRNEAWAGTKDSGHPVYMSSDLSQTAVPGADMLVNKARDMVEKAGMRYDGMQQHGDQRYVTFTDPAHGSTLMRKIEEVTDPQQLADAIKKKQQDFGLQMSTGIPIEKLGRMIKTLHEGAELAFHLGGDGVEVGDPGQPHLQAFGKASADLTSPGRIDEGGKLVAFWGDQKDTPSAKTAATLRGLIDKGMIKRNALVYWDDGSNTTAAKFLNDNGGASVSYMPGVSAPMIAKTVRLARDMTLANGGSTVDPKTGQAVELGPNESFVSIFPKRSMPVDKLTQNALNDFMHKNGDLLKKQDHYLGTWKDPESGKTYIDVTVKVGTEDAKKLGSENFQKAVFGRAGDAKPGDIQTGGSGEAPAGWTHPVPEGERLSAFRESQLPPEERAALAEQRQARTDQPVFRQDFGEQTNQIESAKRAVEYNNQTLGLKDLPVTEDVNENAKRVEDVLGPDLERVMKAWDDHEVQTGTKRQPWYGGMAKAKTILSKYYPELKDATQGKLFSYAMNIFANGDSPNNEFMNGIGAWERRQKTGKFEPMQEGRHEFIGNVRVQTWNSHLDQLQNLIDMKGEKGAVSWLESKHPVAELQDVKTKIRSKLPEYDDEGKLVEPGKILVASEYGRGQPQEGAFVFGPKMGAYGLNKEGISGPVTLDKWMNIGIRIARGIVNTQMRRSEQTGEPVETLAGANTAGERHIGYQAINNLAKKFSIAPEDVQALVWTHVIRPFFERHGQTMKGGSGSHGDFAKWLEESGWLDRRVRGKDASLTEGGEITRQRGLSEGAQNVPESLRPTPPNRGEAYEGGTGDASFDFGPK